MTETEINHYNEKLVGAIVKIGSLFYIVKYLDFDPSSQWVYIKIIGLKQECFLKHDFFAIRKYELEEFIAGKKMYGIEILK